MKQICPNNTNQFELNKKIFNNKSNIFKNKICILITILDNETIIKLKEIILFLRKKFPNKKNCY